MRVPIFRSAADSLHPLLRPPAGLTVIGGALTPGMNAPQRLAMEPDLRREAFLPQAAPRSASLAIQAPDTAKGRVTDSLGIALNARLDTKTDRIRTARCASPT